MRNAIRIGLILSLLLNVSAQVISYPTVPPGLPSSVSIDSLNSVYGGHSFKLDVYSGAFTFHTKAQGDFTGTATVVWLGETDKYNPFHIVLGAKTVIAFSFKTAKVQTLPPDGSESPYDAQEARTLDDIKHFLKASRKGKVGALKFGPNDYVVEGFLDICTQTGEVSLGRLGSAYNISNGVAHAQCSASPPSPVTHSKCITDGSNSLKYNVNSGVFTLIIGGQFRTAGSLGVVASAGDLTLLRAPGDDTDVTVLLIGEFAQVTVLSHKTLLVTFSGTVADCQ